MFKPAMWARISRLFHATMAGLNPPYALLNRTDAHKAWAKQAVQTLLNPIAAFFTCEAVLSEAIFLMRGIVSGRAAIMEMVNDGYLRIDFHASDHADALFKLIKRYDNIPMSLADACMVRMAEWMPQSAVFTLGSDFMVYRKSGNSVIPTISPF
jgi:uncharacterized protein